MTPRQADVAFVLESVPGVRAVHAIKPGSPASAHFDFAIEAEPDQQQQAFAHYMLLRVLTHEECRRVQWLRDFVPAMIGTSLVPLNLTQFERDAAHVRVRGAEPFAMDPFTPSKWPPRVLHRILIIDADADTREAFRNCAYGPGVDCVVRWKDMDAAMHLAGTDGFDVILCDIANVRVAITPNAMQRTVALVNKRETGLGLFAPRRIVKRPIGSSALERAIYDVLARPVPPPELVAVAGASPPALAQIQKPPPRRSLRPGASNQALRLLLVDVEAGIPAAIAHSFSADSAQIDIAYGREAVERAFGLPFHLILCSASTALASDGFLAAIRREDPAGADRIIVLVPNPDVAFVRGQVANRVLPLPIDETILRGLIGNVAPRAIERTAVQEVQHAIVEAAPVEPPRYRRLAVLVVDDHLDTQILFAAGSISATADISHVTTAIAAFEHLTSRAVDVLVISATMRSDGGEPFYRVIWRMLPALKAQTVLLTSLDNAPASARIVQRPLSRALLDGVVSRASR